MTEVFYEAWVYPGPWYSGVKFNDRRVPFVKVTCMGCDYSYRILENTRPLPLCPGCGAWVS